MEKEPTLASVRQFLQSDQVTTATRKALLARLEKPAVTTPAFFSPTEFDRLRLVCDRLIPQSETKKIDLAGPIDERLTNRQNNGWRYDNLPNDGEAYRLFLAGIDQLANDRFGQTFDLLTDEQQTTVLLAVQQGHTTQPIWEQLPGSRFFEELLAEVVEIYYSHPLVQLQIGYTGMADLPAKPKP